jgi:protein-S-isoprenylcysteine O-methyltransferase Ste14
MSAGIYTLLMLNLCFMGLLPRIFFRSDGSFNLMWWLTSGPFFLAAFLASLFYFKFLVLMDVFSAYQLVMEGVCAVLSVASISLMSYTLGTHRRRLALWHQANDAPEEIVTYGAYKYIRHPFYSSFILALLATIVLCPSVWSAVLLVYGFSILNFTAAKEERKLSMSAFGEQYRAYINHSGRFIPKF